MIGMGAFRDRLAAGGRQPRWLDYTDYCGRLLAGGAIPWGDVTRLVDWHRKAQGLLKSDVAALPLRPLIEAWLAAHGDLREAMGGRRRLLYPLKTLLADDALRAHVASALDGLRRTHAGLPLALVLPSPRHFIQLAAAWAGTADADEAIENDDADSASMYLADFLRAFGDAGIDLLLLEERPGEPVSRDGVAAYQAVLNIAGHYRWEIGLRLGGAADDLAGGLAGIDFLIAARPVPGAATGLQLPGAFWTEAEAPVPGAGGDFLFGAIPADARPEVVLERLAALP